MCSFNNDTWNLPSNFEAFEIESGLIKEWFLRLISNLAFNHSSFVLHSIPRFLLILCDSSGILLSTNPFLLPFLSLLLLHNVLLPSDSLGFPHCFGILLTFYRNYFWGWQNSLSPIRSFSHSLSLSLASTCYFSFHPFNVVFYSITISQAFLKNFGFWNFLAILKDRSKMIGFFSIVSVMAVSYVWIAWDSLRFWRLRARI